jgi:hypothetical protein
MERYALFYLSRKGHLDSKAMDRHPEEKEYAGTNAMWALP